MLRRTRAFKDALMQGPAEAAKIKQTEGIKGTALIDTGATHTSMDDELSSALGLVHADWIDIATSSHSKYRAKVYVGAELYMPDVSLVLSLPSVVGASLSAQGIQVLLGRDVLQHAILIYNGAEGSFSFAI